MRKNDEHEIASGTPSPKTPTAAALMDSLAAFVTRCRSYVMMFSNRRYWYHHAAHTRDWVRACKGGAPACSNFGIAGRYTEWLVLGAAAVQYEGKLMWDNAKMEFTNNKDATKWIKPTYRKAWKVKL